MKKLLFIIALLAGPLAHAQETEDLKLAQKLIDKHFAIWSDRNSSHWTSRFPDVYTGDVLVADYGGVATGYASVSLLIERVQRDHPDFSFSPDPVAWNHGIGRVTWGYGPRNNPNQIRGEDIFTIQNGKLSSLRVFINTK